MHPVPNRVLTKLGRSRTLLSVRTAQSFANRQPRCISSNPTQGSLELIYSGRGILYRFR